MGSPFDEAISAAAAESDRVLGGPIRITPRKGGGYSERIADPDRDVADVTGIFSTASEVMDAVGTDRRRTANEASASFGVAPAEALLSAETMAGLGYTIKQGDLVTLTSKPGQPSYGVSRVVPDDNGSVRLILAIEA